MGTMHDIRKNNRSTLMTREASVGYGDNNYGYGGEGGDIDQLQRKIEDLKTEKETLDADLTVFKSRTNKILCFFFMVGVISLAVILVLGFLVWSSTEDTAAGTLTIFK